MIPVEVVPAQAGCGAEVRCGPLREVDGEGFSEIRRAWLDHLVLLFRGQRLDDEDLRRFARRFGPLQRAAPGAGADPVTPAEVHVVSNVVEEGRPLGIQGSGDLAWHSDMAAFPTPPTASLLYALEVPPTGGDTLFLNTYLAWETLPEETKELALGLSIEHGVSPGSAGDGDGVHPLVWTHPETGCNALFLGARENTSIRGLGAAESDALLGSLWAHALRWRAIWRHRWLPGDLVVWDNRCLLHARLGFDPASRRVLHRTQVQGECRPVTAPDALRRPAHRRGGSNPSSVA
jgi:taurine dioxygenase